MKEGESVTLRPLRSASPLKKERGFWVFHGGRKIGAAVTDKVLRDIRTQRAQDNRGPDRNRWSRKNPGGVFLSLLLN